MCKHLILLVVLVPLAAAQRERRHKIGSNRCLVVVVVVRSVYQPLHELIANATAGASDGDQEATQMIQNVTAEADGHLDLVNVTLRTDVLSCAPVRELTAQSVSMTCGYILDPFNGIWFALVICILATILLAFVSTCASKAYRKYEYRAGPRVMEVFSAWDEPIVYESAEKLPTRATRPRFRVLRRFKRHGRHANEDPVEVWRL